MRPRGPLLAYRDCLDSWKWRLLAGLSESIISSARLVRSLAPPEANLRCVALIPPFTMGSAPAETYFETIAEGLAPVAITAKRALLPEPTASVRMTDTSLEPEFKTNRYKSSGVK